MTAKAKLPRNPKLTRVQRLIELELGTPLRQWVRRERRNGLSWAKIAEKIEKRTDVPVTRVALRGWFPDPPGWTPPGQHDAPDQ